VVGVREHDLAMQVLEAPAVLHEVDGQPVEQLGVGRPLASGAEIVGRADETLAEVP
jgi:hypothetical protein